MSIFKKTTRKFRQRQAVNSDAEDAEEDQIPGLTMLSRSETSSPKSSNAILSRPTTVLSFHDGEHDDTEVFKVKKSSQSRKLQKHLKKLKELSTVDKNNTSDGNVDVVDEESASGIEFNVVARRNVVAQSIVAKNNEYNVTNKLPPTNDLQLINRQSVDDNDPLNSLSPGVIPDARLIHEARKRRQRARETGDYIAIEKQQLTNGNNSRLVREDDLDNSDSGSEERVSFEGVKAGINRAQMAEVIEKAASSEDEEIHKWEQLQINKAVSDQQINELHAEVYRITPVEEEQTKLFKPGSISVLPEIDLPVVTVEDILKKLELRLSSMEEVRSSHTQRYDRLMSELKESRTLSDSMSVKSVDKAESFKFFQEKRHYCRNLVDCLTEKMVVIARYEKKVVSVWKTKSDFLVKRRRQDVQDEMAECSSAGSMGAEALYRKSDREARRARRRRNRRDPVFSLNAADHRDGWSSDDDIVPSLNANYTKLVEELIDEAGEIFNDVDDQFADYKQIRRKFEKWKFTYGSSYQESYTNLCVPKLFAPFARLELIPWNVLEGDTASFEQWPWFEDLLLYGYNDAIGTSADDPDINFLPDVVEQSVIAKTNVLIKDVYDPFSASQTERLTTLLRELFSDYPSISPAQRTMELIISKISAALDSDLFIPLMSKQQLESSPLIAAFCNRQFWACAKFLSNLKRFDGLIAADALKQLFFNKVVNRYVMISLQSFPNNNDTLDKFEAVVNCIPRSWFALCDGNNTLVELQNMVRSLVTMANVHKNSMIAASNDLERNAIRLLQRRITKILVVMHALDAAIAMS